MLPHKNNSPNCTPCHSVIRLRGMNLIKGKKVVDKWDTFQTILLVCKAQSGFMKILSSHSYHYTSAVSQIWYSSRFINNWWDPLKYGFYKWYFFSKWTFDQLNISWPFLSSLLVASCNSKATANPPKNDDKNDQEMFNWSEVYSEKKYELLIESIH